MIAYVLLAQTAAEAPTASRRHTLTGDVRTHASFESRILDNRRDVLVYLPPGYGKSRKRYPVFYLQDGQNVFDGATSFIAGQEWRADETAETLIRSGAIEPLIIVAVNNAGAQRMAEYTPAPDAKYKGGNADLYGRMIVEELKPFIDRQYRTRTSAASTGIGGSSLGGLVSLYLALSHPDVFGRVAVLSPSVWWADRDILKRVQSLERKPRLRVWLDIGTAEGKEPTRTLQDARDLRDAFIAQGWRAGKDFQYMEAESAQHNEKAWAERFGDILQFLFPRHERR